MRSQPLLLVAVTAAAAGSVSLDIPFDGTLVAAVLSTTHSSEVEVGFNSTAIQANDSRSAVLGTVGNAAPVVQADGLGIPVAAGERIYLHWAAGAAAKARCYLYIEPKGSLSRPDPRRR